MRTFLEKRLTEALWLLAVIGLALVTLLQLAVYGTLFCVLWVVDHTCGRERA